MRGIMYGAPELRGLHAVATGLANDTYMDATGFPYVRDPYQLEPYGDDAVRLTPEMLAAIRRGYGETSIALVTDEGRIEDARQLGEIDDADLLGAWLVVIDYHC